jgi:hypothetical protein
MSTLGLHHPEAGRHWSSMTPDCNIDGVCNFSPKNGYGDVGVLASLRLPVTDSTGSARCRTPFLAYSWRRHRQRTDCHRREFAGVGASHLMPC